MTTRDAFIVVLVALAASSCQEVPTVAPAELVQPEVAEALMVGEELAAAIQPSSTICQAFRAQAFEFRAQAADRPDDLDLQTAAATLQGIITHTCD
jgi:hypothetical protein